MQLEHVSCYICNSNLTEPWAREQSYEMVKCTNCGLVYLNPRPISSDIDEGCQTGMHGTDGGILNTRGRYSIRKVDEFFLKTSQLFPDEELMLGPCRWLDIGAGYGEFVQALTRLTPPGSLLFGIEPCRPKAKKAKSLGIPVDSARLSDVRGKYTHVSLINVFSHLPNPIEYLGWIQSLMEPGCQLLLVTGNGGDIPREEFPGSLYLPDHLSFAGEPHIKAILDQAGFHIRAIQRYRASVSNDHYLMGLSKNVARWALGRPSVPLKIPEVTRYRSLWIRAQLRN